MYFLPSKVEKQTIELKRLTVIIKPQPIERSDITDAFE